MSTPAQRMVAEQLLPNGVTDERVLEAMSAIPREEFLSGRVRRHAYENRALSIECGQTISQPLVVALMTQALMPQPDDIALEVGTGSGYQAAVLSRLCRKVVTLDREPALAEHASDTLLRLGFVKIFCRPATGVVIGGVVVAPIASELILPIALAVQNNLSVTDLAQTLSVYPSLSGSIIEAARRLMAHDDLD